METKRIDSEMLIGLSHRICGDSMQVRDVSGVDAAAGRPYQGFGEEMVHKTPWSRALALGEGVIQHHPLVDGNKRLAFAGMHMLLRLEETNWTSPPISMYDLIMWLSGGGYEPENYDITETPHSWRHIDDWAWNNFEDRYGALMDVFGLGVDETMPCLACAGDGVTFTKEPSQSDDPEESCWYRLIPEECPMCHGIGGLEPRDYVAKFYGVQKG